MKKSVTTKNEKLLLLRERYLDAITQIQNYLIQHAPPKIFYSEIIKTLGEVTGASRVYIFRNSVDKHEYQTTSQVSEWTAYNMEEEAVNPLLQNIFEFEELKPLYNTLESGEIFKTVVSELPEQERVLFEEQQIKAILIIPLIVYGAYWGFIGFDKCNSHEIWNYQEINMLSSAASSISAFEEKLQAEKTMEISHNTLLTILDNIDALIHVSDMDTYEVLFANKAMHNEFGSIEGKKCYKTLHRDLGEPCTSCDNSELFDYEGNPVGIITRDSFNKITGKWYHISKSAIKWFDGRIVRLEISIDITHRKKMEIELLESKQNLKDLMSTKDKFFSIVAHDLKNPFTAIIGFSKLLMRRIDKLSPEKIKYYISMIYEGTKYEYELLDNLLEWSRIQTGRLQFQPINIELSGIVAESVKLYTSMAESKQIEVNNNVEKNIYVYADFYMLSTILRNLLSNAVKYTENNGKITVDAEIKADFIEISVSDTGIGISKDEIEKLFRIDKNISTFGTSGEKGTGLGLVLCHEFAKKQDGTIRVESTLEKGSSFIITLPRGKPYNNNTNATG